MGRTLSEKSVNNAFLHPSRDERKRKEEKKKKEKEWKGRLNGQRKQVRRRGRRGRKKEREV